jgi:hypothetical protein
VGARKYPLELVLRAHGTAELVDSDGTVLWVSDSDDQFKEEFTDEFLTEDDIEEILDYLIDNGVLIEMEYNALNSDRWDVKVETLNQAAGEPDDDEDDDFDDDDDDFDDDDDDET